MLNPKLPRLWTGGDYSPEQWPEQVWDEDCRLMRLAHFQVATMGMFAWARMEPREGQYDFGWLDDVIERLTQADRWFLLATSSAAPPAWLSKAYPDTLRTGPDGVRRKHGNRTNFSFSSGTYREKTRQIARVLAQRYGSHERLLAWHLSNEYNADADYSEETVVRFRSWLRNKYQDNLDALNKAYWNAFWSHTYSSWDEIEAPGAPYGETAVLALALDWRRFTNDETTDFMLNEAGPLRELSPHVPITTNMMAGHEGLDYRRLAPHLDFVSWDSYPLHGRSQRDPQAWIDTAFNHDLIRSLKPDKPWLLMEYSPSSGNWFEFMELKAPGTHRFETLQAIAHGADGAMVFQWRQSRGSMEQLHGAVVANGWGEHSRVFSESAEVNEEVERLEGVAGTIVKAEAAVVYDWEVGWAIEGANGPVRGSKKYRETAVEHYRALWQAGVAVDLVGLGDDLSQYKLVVAPMAWSLRPGFAERVRAFVEGGGTFVATYLTGWTDENGLIFEGGYLEPLNDVLGVRSEEIDALRPERKNGVSLWGQVYEASDFCELIRISTAEVLGRYELDFYAGRPAITRNRFGSGNAYYVASRNERRFNDEFYRRLAKEAGITVLDLPQNATMRQRGDIQFWMNLTNLECATKVAL